MLDYREAEKSLKRKFGYRHWDSMPHRIRRGARDVIPRWMGENGYKYGAEIGVCAGHYSAVICKNITDVKLLCVDPWTPYRRVSQENQDDLFERTKLRLAPYDATLIRKKSLEAVKDIELGSLDFVYIDGLHDFDNCVMDIIEWSKRVRIGGIISGHDYISEFRQGVVEAVNSYTTTHNVTRWYITRDRVPSFFWVNNGVDFTNG